MIVEQRAAEFWEAIAAHPEVAPHVAFNPDGMQLGEVIRHPSVLPLASRNGGFLFVQLDGLGKVYEVHAMFTPAGWGREASATSKAAFNRLFSDGAQVITSVEVGSWWRSKPPLSHGWKPAGPFTHSPELAAEVRSWILTRDAFEASPARRRFKCHLQS